MRRTLRAGSAAFIRFRTEPEFEQSALDKVLEIEPLGLPELAVELGRLEMKMCWLLHEVFNHMLSTGTIDHFDLEGDLFELWWRDFIDRFTECTSMQTETSDFHQGA